MPLLNALVFAVSSCRRRPRCALEAYNAGTVRIDKIAAIIRDCRWGIHDLSRTEPNAEGLPRFNMPFELGLFLGANRFGDRWQREKSCLVLDRDRFRFQRFISDIGGQDVVAHDDQPVQIIAAVRDWLSAELRHESPRLAGAGAITARFARFQSELPAICEASEREAGSLTYPEYCAAVADWLTEEERSRGAIGHVGSE